MATNHTTNYNLNLWQPTDSFLREEFNENFGKLDAALASLSTAVSSSCVAGSYTPTPQQTQFIELGFRPKLVILGINTYPITPAFGFIADGITIYVSNNRGTSTTTINSMDANLTDTGFRMGYSESSFNGNANATVYYVAFR